MTFLGYYRRPRSLEAKIEREGAVSRLMEIVSAPLEMLPTNVASTDIFEQTNITPNFGSDYYIVLTDSLEDNPFMLDATLQNIANKFREEYLNIEERAKAIYDWVIENTSYDRDYKKHKTPYRNSIEAFLHRKGLCGSLAYLYIAIARAAGLKAEYVHVRKDFQGKDVHHACAAVHLGNRTVFVDLAYYTYDILHQDYKILNDAESAEMYRKMRSYFK